MIPIMNKNSTDKDNIKIKTFFKLNQLSNKSDKELVQVASDPIIKNQFQSNIDDIVGHKNGKN